MSELVVDLIVVALELINSSNDDDDDEEVAVVVDLGTMRNNSLLTL